MANNFFVLVDSQHELMGGRVRGRSKAFGSEPVPRYLLKTVNRTVGPYNEMCELYINAGFCCAERHCCQFVVELWIQFVERPSWWLIELAGGRQSVKFTVKCVDEKLNPIEYMEVLQFNGERGRCGSSLVPFVSMGGCEDRLMKVDVQFALPLDEVAAKIAAKIAARAVATSVAAVAAVAASELSLV